MESQNGKDRTGRILWAVVGLAFALRVLLALISDNFNHPDENFQILEQAHRAVFGYGVIPWEYRFAARSWLVPGLAAVLLYPFKLLGLGNPDIYVPSIKIILSLISLAVIFSAYHIGKKLSSPKAGLWAAFFCAVWYEMIYFSIRPLSEVWATTFLLGSIALSLDGGSRKRIILAAILACLAAAIRINYIPVVLVFALMTFLGLNTDNRRVYIYSFVAGMVFVGLFETITVGKPFISYLNFYLVNKTFFMAGTPASIFSIEYLKFLGWSSTFLFWAIFVAGFFVWQKSSTPMLLIIVILLSHLLVPAKKHQIDYRHIYAAIPLLMIVGGMLCSEMLAKIRMTELRKLSAVAASVIIILISTLGAFGYLPGQAKVYEGKTFEVYNHSLFFKDARLEAYRFLNKQTDIRGVYDVSGLWFRSGGFYYLHRDVPLYFDNTPPATLAYISHIITSGQQIVMPGFQLMTSIENIQIYTRSDKTFRYKTDPSYTRNMPQPGVDGSFRL